MPNRSTASTIDAYIAEFPPEVQASLERIRALVHEVAPDAVETISYAIPTFDLGGKHLVHFAGYEHHVGFYPTPSGMAAFDEELQHYQRGKGSARFPLGEELPMALIRRIIEYRVSEVGGGVSGAGSADSSGAPPSRKGD